MSGQTRKSADLWLISGGLVWAGVKVDSAWWDSCGYLERSVKEPIFYLTSIASPIFSLVFSFGDLGSKTYTYEQLLGLWLITVMDAVVFLFFLLATIVSL